MYTTKIYFIAIFIDSVTKIENEIKQKQIMILLYNAILNNVYSIPSFDRRFSLALSLSVSPSLSRFSCTYKLLLSVHRVSFAQDGG